MHKALLSSKDMNWCTPQKFYDELNEEFHFVLDPAATDETAKCSLYYTPETDGLSQSWDCGGAVFCNPPYGREIGKWIEKAYEESQKTEHPIVLLIPARTDTSFFMTTFMARQKYASCEDEFDLPIKTELHIMRLHSHQ